MYRRIRPDTPRELALRMLYQPLGDGLFHRACEADSFRGLVAALLDEPDYELADVETRRLTESSPSFHDALETMNWSSRRFSFGSCSRKSWWASPASSSSWMPSSM
jgi:hypothetical protein